MRYLVFALSILMVSVASPCFSQTTTSSEAAAPNVDEAFRSGNALMAESKYCEALSLYQVGLKSQPDDTLILYNGGLAAFKCKQYPVALNLWIHLKTLTPDDWQTRAKLVQTYQILGKLPERDAERLALFDLRKQDSTGELAKQLQYCRDQFEAAGEAIMVFEEFELKGDRAVRYIFSVLDASRTGEKYRLSLGSYDATNEVWRETTKPRPKDSDRLFHLDGYYDWGHATYGMYFPEPSYDQVRAAVIDVLGKRTKPMSMSRVEH
jgi:tetratricopeptide (TPR) repeat protein